MKAVIEQPTYLSWAGYFGLMDTSDIFVFYDDVQFSKQSWQQRNRIKTSQGKWIWLTVPVFHRIGQKINEVKIDNSSDWRRKHWESIRQSYSKASYYKRYCDELEELYHCIFDSLADWDMSIVLRLARLLGVKMPKLYKSSEIEGLTGCKTNRLISLLDKMKVDEYVTSYGTKAYIEPDKFKNKNIKLYWYECKPIRYPQINGIEFVPYMSVIDMLMNAGDKAIEYIRGGIYLKEEK